MKFRLRTLMLSVLVCALIAAWYAERLRSEAAIETLRTERLESKAALREAKILVSTASTAIAGALTTSEIVIRLEQFDFPSSDVPWDSVSEYVNELLVKEVVNIWHTKSEINATMNSFYSDVSGTPNQDWAQHLASDLLRIMKCNSTEQFADAAQSAGVNLLETQTNADLFEIGSEEYKSFSEFVARAINECKSR